MASAPISSPSSPQREHLERIASLTDASLAHLGVDELLDELLGKVQGVLEVDTAAVLLLDPDEAFLVATAARGIEEEVTQGVRIPVGRGFAGKIAAEKRPVVLDRVDHTTVLNPILRDRKIRSLAGVPLLIEGRVVGVLHVGSLGTREFTDDDVQLLQLVGDRVALAVQSRLAEIERTAATTLQESLIPGALPDVPGMEFAARYVPGGVGEVGGDWYDVAWLPSGCLLVVIGDVVGRGLRSAIVMGRLRSAVRSYSMITDDPGEVLDLVDRKIRHFEPGAMATGLVAIFNPSLQQVTISSAGHLPPVLAVPDEPSRLLDLPVDPPVGVGMVVRRHVTTVDLPEGALLFFYTDGLVERRDVSIDDRLADLCDSVTADAAHAVTAAVMQRLVGTTRSSDDIAVLAARRRAGTPVAPFAVDVAAVPTNLTKVRASLRGWLAGAGASDDEIQDLVLAAGEALANAVEHAYGAQAGRVYVEGALEGREVVLTVRDTGRWRTQRSQDRGRGTMIMQKTTDSLEIRDTGEGTVVTMRRRLAS
ncbi:MAG TPA: SpoIIE family protein phosphatase [Acidimicrobiia bacterium]|nr:SpoIIE family protein phosphatase [Acidimicrobiia bacterium]